jgi:hypothetical protein
VKIAGLEDRGCWGGIADVGGDWRDGNPGGLEVMGKKRQLR